MWAKWLCTFCGLESLSPVQPHRSSFSDSLRHPRPGKGCLRTPPLSNQSSHSLPRTATPAIVRGCWSSGGLNLAAYTASGILFQDRDEAEKILKKLQAGEMPPKALPRPNAEELKAVTSWIEEDLDRQAKAAPRRVMARRLNRVEYNNTVRDLLGVDVRPADDFPQDDSAYGFDNIAQALSVSPLLMEKYVATAERIARMAVFGPNLKTLTTVYLPPLPRRMETTNRTLVPFPAYYSMTDYDRSGLSQPGSFHKTHTFPADGEYLIRIAGAGFRPTGSEPGQMTFWLDGKLVQTFQVDIDVEQSGFERRPDHWDVRLKVSAGPHGVGSCFFRISLMVCLHYSEDRIRPREHLILAGLARWVVRSAWRRRSKR